ncbi:MAG: cytochrome c biogenesis protein CcdA, partial [Clostridiales bacterium]|nr:cytochrome c biogenesis protein CcdA [Clostridiales bacterium]
MTELLEHISELIARNAWLSPLMALFAGVLASFTPCSLSTVPLVIGYVGGTGQTDTKKAFRLSLVFVLGSAATFTVLGFIASTAGKLIGTSSSWWYFFLGVLMILMA